MSPLFSSRLCLLPGWRFRRGVESSRVSHCQPRHAAKDFPSAKQRERKMSLGSAKRWCVNSRSMAHLFLFSFLAVAPSSFRRFPEQARLGTAGKEEERKDKVLEAGGFSLILPARYLSLPSSFPAGRRSPGSRSVRAHTHLS